MAYDQAKLITSIRMKLGGISSATLPDSVIIYWGDYYDELPQYTDNFPWIYYKTILECINYLKANAISSGSVVASEIREKVGLVERTVKNSSSSGGNVLDIWDKLYASYLKDPESFGIIKNNSRGVVILGGTSAKIVSENYRNNDRINGVITSDCRGKVDDKPWRIDNGDY